MQNIQIQFPGETVLSFWNPQWSVNTQAPVMFAMR